MKSRERSRCRDGESDGFVAPQTTDRNLATAEGPVSAGGPISQRNRTRAARVGVATVTFRAAAAV